MIPPYFQQEIVKKKNNTNTDIIEFNFKLIYKVYYLSKFQKRRRIACFKFVYFTSEIINV